MMHPIENIMKSAMEEIKEMVDVNLSLIHISEPTRP